ncbi:putative MATE family efflux protein [Sporomusaceae bacterium BoRhaA]|uniref:MATE family efflux transporter n=1 Tax=Pelorhabdus rhamnosifermentans TaxID=2772457 RepID=UPI001C063571|nr:MATE family efflux transporter [Pelorhabdus rhamnosifermentans]MBU2699707.1 putative MATE family efflux protein [Pelorhabdus rhamnosifermentans]
MNEKILGEEKIATLFLKYSIPAISGMLFLGLNTIVDGFFVGHYIGVNALASVNIAMPFFSLMIAVGVVIGIGTQSIIGKKLGESNIEEASDTFKTSLSFMSGASLLFLVIAIGFTKQIAAFLGANEQLMPMVITYISYESLFLPFLGVMFVLDYVLKLMGKPVYSMLALVIAVISHMMFNYLFIVQLGLGIKGAALAAGLGYSIAFVMTILPFIMGRTTLKLFKGNFKKSLACNVIYNGSSEGLSEIGTGVTTFLFNITLMHYVGEVGVAAFTAISYLSFIGNNILIGLSDGVGTIISYNYGSGKIERVKKALKLAGFSAIIIGVGLFSVISIFAREIIAIFLDANHEQAFNFAVYGARLYTFAFLVNGLNVVSSGYFTAICKPKSSGLIALSKGIVWIGIGIVMLPQIFGIKGIWLTVPVAEMLTLILSGSLMYKHFKYQIQPN